MRVFQSISLSALCLLALLAASTADTKVKSPNKGDHRMKDDEPSAKDAVRDRFMGADGKVRKAACSRTF